MAGVAAFFGLVVLLAAPFWVLGAFVDQPILPGLPIAALAVVCPTLAAAALTLRHDGRAGVAGLLRRVLRLGDIRRWLLPATLVNPILFGLAFIISRLLGSHIPYPSLSLPSGLLLLALFLPTALLEEIGWSGYALPRLQELVSPLVAALALGAFWALWHVPALLQAHRSLEWVAWWCAWTVSARILMVWLYNWAGKSVLAVVIYHALSNLCWQIYPIDGSYFDPRTSGLVTLVVAVSIVVFLPQPRGPCSASR